jgi:hypothetical protein
MWRLWRSTSGDDPAPERVRSAVTDEPFVTDAARYAAKVKGENQVCHAPTA